MSKELDCSEMSVSAVLVFPCNGEYCVFFFFVLFFILYFSRSLLRHNYSFHLLDEKWSDKCYRESLL